MARAGRKRHVSATRDAAGYPRRQEDYASATKLQRRRKQLEAMADDPLNSYPLGRLLVLGDITQEQYEAGTYFAEMKWSHARIVGLMLPMSKCIDWDRVYGRGIDKLDPDDPAISERERERRLQEIDHIKSTMRAMEGELRKISLGAVREVTEVCVCDYAPSSVYLVRLGLGKLVEKGLTRPVRSDKRKNA